MEEERRGRQGSSFGEPRRGKRREDEPMDRAKGR